MTKIMGMKKFWGYVTSLSPDLIGHGCETCLRVLNLGMTRTQDNFTVNASLPRKTANFYEKAAILRPLYRIFRISLYHLEEQLIMLPDPNFQLKRRKSPKYSKGQDEKFTKFCFF